MNRLLTSSADVAFLSEMTGLSDQRVLLLTEEARDMDLVINAICAKPWKTKSIFELSLPLFAKLSVFKLSKDLDYSLEEKSYVADAVAAQFIKIKKAYRPKITDSFNEQACQYYLVLIGLYKEKLNSKKKERLPINDCITKVENGFLSVGKREMAFHTRTWIGILDKLKKESWK